MYRASGPNENGTSNVMPHMKLAARQGDSDRMMQALWVNSGLLLTSSHESLLRFWKLASDENFILRIEDEQVPPDDRIQAVAYSEHNRLLCAGTSKGYILFWRQTSVCLRSSPCLAVCLAVCLKALAVCLKAMPCIAPDLGEGEVGQIQAQGCCGTWWRRPHSAAATCVAASLHL
jgi:WD40 repeat protein